LRARLFLARRRRRDDEQERHETNGLLHAPMTCTTDARAAWPFALFTCGVTE
jgi:hypothetical protein